MRGLILKKNAGALRGRDGKERMQMRIRKVAIYARVSTEHDRHEGGIEVRKEHGGHPPADEALEADGH